MMTTKAARTRRRTFSQAGLAAVSILTVLGCTAGCSSTGASASNAALTNHANASSPSTTGLSDSAQYSITQTVDNQSSVPLTLAPDGVWVDNGGSLRPGYATTIAAGTSQVYVASNTGNGVQMKLTFTTPSGATAVVDTDVPHHKSNWS